ncbi:MAG: dephospho-CoA kinase [Acidobacteria bacterium]|nr:MAG: dephospho-CoA kinase [Acidobacteriota bacterium]
MSRLLVGLTGGLASGKSTVGELLRREGFLVLDADRLVAELYAPGEPGAAAVRALLGDGALTAEGGVDRPAVARRVFADPDLRRRLEEAIHPLVRRRFAERAARAEGVVVLEAPLLIEGGLAGDFDLVVTVEADAETRIRRAVERGLDEAAARARLAAQLDGAARRARADRVIDNDGTLDDLRRQVAALAAELRRRAGG